VTILGTAFCVVTPCSPVEIHRRFGGPYFLHLHGRRLSLLLACFLLALLFDHDDGGNTFLRIVGGVLPDCTASHKIVLLKRKVEYDRYSTFRSFRKVILNLIGSVVGKMSNIRFPQDIDTQHLFAYRRKGPIH
jgi:hypothetical protein